jgi:hypothetical protein
MFGFTQSREKQPLHTETTRAERALEAVYMQPLVIQQDIARHALQECVVTLARLGTVSPVRERESLYLLRLAELDQKINEAEAEFGPHNLEPSEITAIFTRTLLGVSSGVKSGAALQSVCDRIARWSRNILPDFDRFERQLTH